MRKTLTHNQYNYTLEEVASELGVCRERVRQIEKQALEKVRAGFAARGITRSELDDYDDDPKLFDIKKVLPY